MDEATTVKVVSRRMRLLRSYLRPELRFLELGPGDCRLSFEVAKSVRRVYAIDVSAEITRHLAYPKNFDLIISNGCNVPVPEASIDVAYSNQLMEHLHPDDAIEQLRNVYRALVPGGVYICITPNRLSGPHDISKYFDEVATGLHLKEYTLGELDEFLHKVGFRKTQAYISGKGIYIRCSCSFIRLCERAVGALPPSLRKWIAASMILRPLLTTLTVVGIK
jgi:SAM-dependent methyltransferase